MLRSLENLLGYRITGSDGDMGNLEDFLFVDDDWKVRYLAVATGSWLDRRQVLLSPESVWQIVDSKREVFVGLTRELVYSSPRADSDKPVSRQKEILLAQHYGWQPYWTPDSLLGAPLVNTRLDVEAELEGCNPHLRSFREISTYAVWESQPLGLVTDFISNDFDWQIHGIVMTKGSKRHGTPVLVPPDWVQQIDWKNRALRTAERGSQIADFPPFDFSAAINRGRIVRYFDYYGRLHHSVVDPRPHSGGNHETNA